MVPNSGRKADSPLISTPPMPASGASLNCPSRRRSCGANVQASTSSTSWKISPTSMRPRRGRCGKGCGSWRGRQRWIPTTAWACKGDAMPTKSRMNVYFEPELLKQVEALALRRNVSKSAVIEAALASFLSEDSAERLEAVFARRMDRLGRQIDGMDEDLAILGETVSLFIRFWLTITPPLPDSAQASARAKGLERFEGFVQALGRRLARGDRFIREVSRDIQLVGATEASTNVDDNNDPV